MAMPHDHGQKIDTVLSRMPEAGYFIEAADAFSQLADGSRLRILWILCHCEECVSNISAAVNMTPAAVSHHLKTLRQHGLLTSRRVGKEVHYTLAASNKARLVHRIIEDYFQITCPDA